MTRCALALALASLSAQESSNAIPRNPQAVQNAIAGIGRRPLSESPQIVRAAPPASKTCSVPLLPMPINKDQFAARQIPAPEVEPMPRVTVPAPACEGPAR